MGFGWGILNSHDGNQGISGSNGRNHGNGGTFIISTGSFQSGATMAPNNLNNTLSNSSSNGTLGVGNTASNSTNAANATFSEFIQQLFVRERIEHRQTVVITSALSILASAIVIGVVLYDAQCFQRSRVVLRNGKLEKTRFHWTSLHPAEVFALAVAVAAVIQSVIFIGVQSTTIYISWATGCALTAQLVWPASWLVAIMILVFSLEIAIRSLRMPKFKPRGKWTILVCAAIVVAAMFSFWLSAFLSKPNQMCWGSLLFWTFHFSRAAIVINVVTIFTSLVTATTLVYQLVKTVQMEKSERIAATRVVYALGVNAVVLLFILPFWISVCANKISPTASEIADVVVTLNGVVQGILHLLLRVNSDRFAVRPRETPWTEKRSIRLIGTNDVNIHEYISSPLLLDNDGNRLNRAPVAEDESSRIGIALQPDTPRSPQRPVIFQPIDTSAEAAVIPRPSITTPRRVQPSASYSLFPTAASQRLPVASWATEFSTESEEMEPPAPLFSRRHGRNDSTQTSETVEFALRLSDAPPGMLSPVIGTPMGPTSRSPVIEQATEPRRTSLGEELLSPARYIPPRTPTSPAIEARATRVAFERPKAPAALSTLRIPKLKRNISIRDSFAVLHQHRRREVDKSLPPLPRDSSAVSTFPPAVTTEPVPKLEPATAAAPKGDPTPARIPLGMNPTTSALAITTLSPVIPRAYLPANPRPGGAVPIPTQSILKTPAPASADPGTAPETAPRKAPDWREASRGHRPQFSVEQIQQRTPYQFPSPTEGAPSKPAEWI